MSVTFICKYIHCFRYWINITVNNIKVKVTDALKCHFSMGKNTSFFKQNFANYSKSFVPYYGRHNTS